MDENSPGDSGGLGKAKSKVLILDANDTFAKKALFEQGLNETIPGVIKMLNASVWHKA